MYEAFLVMLYTVIIIPRHGCHFGVQLSHRNVQLYGATKVDFVLNSEEYCPFYWLTSRYYGLLIDHIDYVHGIGYCSREQYKMITAHSVL